MLSGERDGPRVRVELEDERVTVASPRYRQYEERGIQPSLSEIPGMLRALPDGWEIQALEYCRAMADAIAEVSKAMQHCLSWVPLFPLGFMDTAQAEFDRIAAVARFEARYARQRARKQRRVRRRA